MVRSRSCILYVKYRKIVNSCWGRLALKTCGRTNKEAGMSKSVARFFRGSVALA